MASLDKTLDDMIKSRRNSDRGGRGQGRPRRGRGSGISARGLGGRTFAAIRRNPLGVNARPSAYTIAKSFRRTKNLPWQNGLFEDSLKAAGMSGLETGTKLSVSNLDAGVTSDDIRELFSEVGELVRYALHFDKNGRPSGSAEVVYVRRSDAFQAFKRYNNVQLDGKPMKIEIVGVKDETPIAARVNVVGGSNGIKRTVVMASGAGPVRGAFARVNRVSAQRGRGGSSNVRGGPSNVRGGAVRGGRGGARGGARWREKNVEKTADELDKELDDTYHAEAMQT